MKQQNWLQYVGFVAILLLILFAYRLNSLLAQAYAVSEMYQQQAADAMALAETAQDALVEAQAGLDQVSADLDTLEADWDAEKENAFYEGMISDCLALYSNNAPMLSWEKKVEICSAFVLSAMDVKAYPTNTFLERFYQDAEVLPSPDNSTPVPAPHPPAPKNQAAPRTPNLNINARFIYGTSLLGH